METQIVPKPAKTKILFPRLMRSERTGVIYLVPKQGRPGTTIQCVAVNGFSDGVVFTTCEWDALEDFDGAVVLSND